MDTKQQIESNVCMNACFGIEGVHGGCCNIEDRDWIIGNDYPDAIDFLDRLSTKLGRRVEFNEIFYDHEEGSQLFPERPTWQKPESYPALRLDTSNPHNACIFYNQSVRACMVYDIRPKVCQQFRCAYLRSLD